MKLIIFSDAICTWSYGEEKILRAIDYIYDGKIEFENIMGGLISDYHDILPMNMKDKDSDEMANKILFQIWKSGEKVHNMPIMKGYPKLLSRKNPSTNKIDMAFIAARMTDSNLANKFLRKLREATLLDGLNTMDNEVCKNIASKIGIDKDKYLENLVNFSNEEFLEDRIKTFDRRITAFPNFMYVDENGKEYLLKGYKTKKELEEFIDRFSNLDKREVIVSEESIYDFIKNYERVFSIELEEIFGNDSDKLKAELDKLLKDNKLIRSKINDNNFEYSINS